MTKRPARGRVARVRVAGEIGFTRSVELVDKALRALGGRSDYEVIVNCHPMVDLSQAAAAMGDGARESNVRITAVTARDLLPEADMFRYGYPHVCFEALRYGVPPVFVRAEGWLNMDELEHAPDCRWVATTPEEIREAVDEIVRLPDDAWWRWYRRSQDALAYHMAPPTPELLDRFLGLCWRPAITPLTTEASAPWRCSSCAAGERNRLWGRD